MINTTQIHTTVTRIDHHTYFNITLPWYGIPHTRPRPPQPKKKGEKHQQQRQTLKSLEESDTNARTIGTVWQPKNGNGYVFITQNIFWLKTEAFRKKDKSSHSTDNGQQKWQARAFLIILQSQGSNRGTLSSVQNCRNIYQTLHLKGTTCVKPHNKTSMIKKGGG